MFNADKTIGIVSNKESSAKMILARIKRIYEQLPPYLKPGVTEYAKTGIAFDNGTRMLISATSPDAFRGESINILICDEFAFVLNSQAEDFWSANYPTVSSSLSSKIIIISTPNGLFNIFHSLYSNAEAGKNSFVPIKVSWERVPNRDQAWADDQIKNFGQQKFNQEFAVEFIGSANTVIEANTLKTILALDVDPIQRDLNNRLKIWEKPKPDAVYVLGCDPAKGTGENWSTIQILKIKSVVPMKLEQVAVFRDNLTDVFDYSDIILRLALFYNSGFVMCENNGEGSSVVNRLWWEHEYENLINSGSKAKNLGIRSTGGEKKGTKPKAVLLMKRIIEDGSLRIYDNETLEELGSYIEEGGKFFGKDKPDDLVSGLFWGCYIFEMNILDEKYKFMMKDEDDAWGILSDIEVEVDADWSWLDDSMSLRD